MRYTGRILKEDSKKIFNKKEVSKETIQKNGSMIVHGKDKKKHILKIKKTTFQRKKFSQKPIPKSYQWGYTGKLLICKTQK